MTKHYIIIINHKQNYMVDEDNYKKIKQKFLTRESIIFTRIGSTRNSEIGIRCAEINHLAIFECDEEEKLQ